MINSDNQVQGFISKEDPPLLFLEVNIKNGQQTKLLIFEGDVPEEIVSVFGLVFEITETKMMKLL